MINVEMNVPINTYPDRLNSSEYGIVGIESEKFLMPVEVN
jgi:hypothetical protein